VQVGHVHPFHAGRAPKPGLLVGDGVSERDLRAEHMKTAGAATACRTASASDGESWVRTQEARGSDSMEALANAERHEVPVYEVGPTM